MQYEFEFGSAAGSKDVPSQFATIRRKKIKI
jgi:hypothetical protein